MFEGSVRECIDLVLEGFNSTVMAYGQVRPAPYIVIIIIVIIIIIEDNGLTHKRSIDRLNIVVIAVIIRYVPYIIIIIIIIILIVDNGLTRAIDRSIDGLELELDLQVRPLYYHHHHHHHYYYYRTMD